MSSYYKKVKKSHAHAAQRLSSIKGRNLAGSFKKTDFGSFPHLHAPVVQINPSPEFAMREWVDEHQRVVEQVKSVTRRVDQLESEGETGTQMALVDTCVAPVDSIARALPSSIDDEYTQKLAAMHEELQGLRIQMALNHHESLSRELAWLTPVAVVAPNPTPDAAVVDPSSAPPTPTAQELAELKLEWQLALQTANNALMNDWQRQLQMQHEAHMQSIQSIQTQLAQCKLECADHVTLSTLQSQLEAMKTSLASSPATPISVYAPLEDIRSQLIQLQSTMESMRTTEATTNQALEAKIQALESLKTDIDQMVSKANQESRDRLIQWQSQMDQQLNSKIQTLETNLAETRDHWTAEMNAVRAEFQASLTLHTQTIAELQSQWNVDHTQKNHEFTSVTSTLARMGALAEQTQTQLNALQSTSASLDQLREMQTSHDQRFRALQQEVETQLARLGEVDRLQTQLDTLQSEWKTKQTWMEEIQTQLNSTKQHLATCSTDDQWSTIKSELATMDQKLMQLGGDNSAWKDKLNQDVLQCQHQLQSLNQQLQMYGDQHEWVALKEEYQTSFSAHVKDCQAELKVAEDKLSKISAELDIVHQETQESQLALTNHRPLWAQIPSIQQDLLKLEQRIHTLDTDVAEKFITVTQKATIMEEKTNALEEKTNAVLNVSETCRKLDEEYQQIRNTFKSQFEALQKRYQELHTIIVSNMEETERSNQSVRELIDLHTRIEQDYKNMTHSYEQQQQEYQLSLQQRDDRLKLLEDQVKIQLDQVEHRLTSMQDQQKQPNHHSTRLDELAQPRYITPKKQ